jgi:hypothetical protein
LEGEVLGMSTRETTGAAIEPVRPDRDMVAAYMDAVFGYCEGWVPIRALPEKGAADRPPHTPFIQADAELAAKTAVQADWAAAAGMALYAVPGMSAPRAKPKPRTSSRPRWCWSIWTTATSPPSGSTWYAIWASRPWRWNPAASPPRGN